MQRKIYYVDNYASLHIPIQKHVIVQTKVLSLCNDALRQKLRQKMSLLNQICISDIIYTI